jgi:ABC-type hemin transport system ATPase subunit
MIDEALFEGDLDEIPRLNGDIVLDRATVRDTDGNLVLEDLTATLPGGGVIGIAAPGEEDRRALAALLTREMLPRPGKVEIAGHDLSTLHQKVIAARIGHASSRPVLFQGTFGDNVMMPVRLRPLSGGQDAKATGEALRAGNSLDPFDAEWTDPAIAGCDSEPALRAWWRRLIGGLGPGTALFRRGLDQDFEAGANPDLAARLVQLRPLVQDAVQAAGLQDCAYFFDPGRYNPGLPVAENLLFATPRQPITPEFLAGQTRFLHQLRKLDLDEGLLALTRDVIDMLRQIFGRDGTDHPLFRRLGVDAAIYERVVDLVEKTRQTGAATLDGQEMAYLLTVPFRISAEQIGPSFSDAMKARILDLRRTHSADLLGSLDTAFAPLRMDAFAPGLTVLENALYGKVSGDAGARAEELRRLVAGVLIDNDAQDLVADLIYDLPIGLGGQNLPQAFAEPLAFCRATIKKPDILILDQALASFDMDTKISVFRNLRDLLPDTTLIYLDTGFEHERVFDLVIEVQQGRIVNAEVPIRMEEEDGAASADLARKVRALEQTPLFSGLDRRQLRLLAFGARWFKAKASEVVFLKGDKPTDGAYMVIEGEAGLYLPQPDAEDRLIATVGPGTLVGELGLIRKEPRALSMIAKTDLTCLRIGEEEFMAVVENDAAVAFKLLQVVAGYLSK